MASTFDNNLRLAEKYNLPIYSATVKKNFLVFSTKYFKNLLSLTSSLRFIMKFSE